MLVANKACPIDGSQRRKTKTSGAKTLDAAATCSRSPQHMCLQVLLILFEIARLEKSFQKMPA